jgi:hypothetical protein
MFQWRMVMSQEVINSWIKKAKSAENATTRPAGVQVIKRVETRGNIIMEVAEKLRPYLAKMFEGIRDEEGLLLQPAHVRGIALNMAQELVKRQDNKA